MRKLSALLAAVTLLCGLILVTSGPQHRRPAHVAGLPSLARLRYDLEAVVPKLGTGFFGTAKIPRARGTDTAVLQLECADGLQHLRRTVAAADNSCGVVVHQGDYITVSVTLDFGTYSETYSSSADIEPYCGTQFC